MNTISVQMLFVIFYAIFWGANFNVLPRWKPFQYPLICKKQVFWRIILSHIFFNFIPLIFFCLVFSRLQKVNIEGSMFMPLIGIVPAFAIFGFYRVWLGIVELSPETFYFSDEKDIPEGYDKSEKTIKELGIIDRTWWKNCLWGVLYIGVASLVGFLCC